MSMRTVALAVMLLLPTRAWAAVPALPSIQHTEPPPAHYANLRIGPSTSTGRPIMCLELSPNARIGLESCGTGAGFMHHDPGPELAHFRGHLHLKQWATPFGWLQPRVTAGFAEAQVGQDEAGFDFTSAGADGHETAGPEVGVSLRALTPMGRGFELVSELQAGAAWLPYAPDLVQPMPRLQPSASLTFGFGF